MEPQQEPNIVEDEPRLAAHLRWGDEALEAATDIVRAISANGVPVFGSTLEKAVAIAQLAQARYLRIAALALVDIAKLLIHEHEQHTPAPETGDGHE